MSYVWNFWTFDYLEYLRKKKENQNDFKINLKPLSRADWLIYARPWQERG